jgi:hypothetical protein
MAWDYQSFQDTDTTGLVLSELAKAIGMMMLDMRLAGCTIEEACEGVQPLVEMGMVRMAHDGVRTQEIADWIRSEARGWPFGEPKPGSQN